MYDMMPDAAQTLPRFLPAPHTEQDAGDGDGFPLYRPRLLAKAARLGARAYRRCRDLPGFGTQSAARIRAKLAEVEARLEDDRRAGAPHYRPGRHVQVLAALLAESAAT